MERSIHSGGVGKALVMSFHFRDPNYELDKKAFDITEFRAMTENCETALFQFSIFLPFLAARQHF